VSQPARPRFDILAVLMLGGFLNFLTIIQVSPLVPGIAREFGVSTALAGQLSTLSAIVAFAGSLAATPFMDRHSRRTWLRAEVALLAIGLAMAVFAPSFAWLAAGRAISGLGLSVLTANTYAAARDVFEEPWRTRTVGLSVSASILAFILGLPIVTAVNASYGWRAALAVTVVPLVIFLAGTTRVPATRPAPTGGGIFGAFRVVGGHPEVMWLYGALAATIGVYGGWLAYFGAYLDEEFAIPAATLGLLFLVSGSVELVGNNLIPAIIRRIGPAPLVIAGMAACALPLLLTGMLFDSIPAAFVMATLLNVGSAAVIIGVNARLLSVDTTAPGAVMSLAAAANGLGGWSGPLLAGWLLAVSGEYAISYRLLGVLPVLGVLCVVRAGRAQSRDVLR
jgi:MFS transporter, DHA1 family, inner membrane transport protein